MSNVTERLQSLDRDTVSELDGALDALERARDQVVQTSYLGDGGELIATVAFERASADQDAASRRLADLVLDALRSRPSL